MLRILDLNTYLLLIDQEEHRGNLLGDLLFYYHWPLSQSIDHK